MFKHIKIIGVEFRSYVNFWQNYAMLDDCTAINISANVRLGKLLM